MLLRSGTTDGGARECFHGRKPSEEEVYILTPKHTTSGYDDID